MNRLPARTSAAILGLVAAAVLTACNGDEPGPPPPTPTQAATSVEPTPTDGATPVEPTVTTSQPTEPDGQGTALSEVTEDPANAHPLPEAPPESFGDWTVVQGTISPRGGLYSNSEGQFITATHVPLQTAQDGLERITEAEFVENWYCGPSLELEGDDMCFTSAFQAQVYLLAEDIPYDQMAAFGNELLTNWT